MLSLACEKRNAHHDVPYSAISNCLGGLVRDLSVASFPFYAESPFYAAYRPFRFRQVTLSRSGDGFVELDFHRQDLDCQ